MIALLLLVTLALGGPPRLDLVGRPGPTDVVVVIGPDGSLVLDGEAVALQELSPSLRRLRSERGLARVILDPHADVPHGQVQQVVHALRRNRVQIALAAADFHDDSVTAPVAARQVAAERGGEKPRRRHYPQNPYASVDFTAYTVERGETRVGLFNVQHGISHRVQVGTVPTLFLLGVPNLNLKGNAWRRGRFDASVQGNLYVVPVNRLIERYSDAADVGLGSQGEEVFTSTITFLGLGAGASYQVARPRSVHGGLGYQRVGAAGQLDLGALPVLIAPGHGEVAGSDGVIVPRLVGEMVNLKLATDVRFNRRDSLVLQYQAPIYVKVRGAVGHRLEGAEGPSDIDVIVAYGGFVPAGAAYRWSLSWQFSWSRVDLRLGVGGSPIAGSWLLQAVDLSYRFGGHTRREEKEIRREYRRRDDRQQDQSP